MYYLTAEACFDSAHFLSGYNGKCSNLHGHRWRITAEIYSDKLNNSTQLRGMVVDFGDLKSDLKKLADEFDHKLIIEQNSLKNTTLEALRSENFSIIELPFRPTAEELASYFYHRLSEFSYNVSKVTVYETPNNCASYSEEEKFHA